MTLERARSRSGRRCAANTAAGTPCKQMATPGREVCRWHDPSPDARARHRAESARGGKAKAYAAIPAIEALASDPTLANLNLGTAAGLRDFLAVTLAALTRLPFDTRTANAIGGLVTAQRSLIEASDFEKRLAALEAAQLDGRSNA
jgi:hypothetical protein